MIAQGSILTLSITSVTTTDTADSIVQQVSAALSTDGRLQVVGSPQIGGSLFNSVIGMIESLSIHQPFQVTMQVLANTSFVGDNDPISIVEGMFENVTGFYPTAASTTGVQVPGAVTSTATGQPASFSTGIGGSQSNSTGISDVVSNFISQLTGTAKSILIGLAAIIVLALVLIAYGPNIGKVASAV